jgi:hypothetical protein
MRQLTGLDSQFLAIESPVGATLAHSLPHANDSVTSNATRPWVITLSKKAPMPSRPRCGSPVGLSGDGPIGSST